jgi:hypothetical protein
VIEGNTIFTPIIRTLFLMVTQSRGALFIGDMVGKAASVCNAMLVYSQTGDK